MNVTPLDHGLFTTMKLILQGEYNIDRDAQKSIIQSRVEIMGMSKLSNIDPLYSICSNDFSPYFPFFL